MANIKEKLVEMLNKALMLEHAARIQYLAHAELVKGLMGEAVIARLREIASDEEKHEGKFRNLIGGYLGGEPVMELAETHSAKEIKKILEVNLKGEQDAIAFYKQIYKTVLDNKESLPYAFETLEHEIRHVIIDEQEHVVELSLLLGV
ncbi:MAG: ferritin-like domain-containing protein [Candidatus Omnitrophota bacterium]